MQFAKERVAKLSGAKNAEKVLFLMDYRTNKARYEAQLMEAEAKEAARLGRRAPAPAASAPDDDDEA